MIEIKPLQTFSSSCPKCYLVNESQSKVFFQGIRVLGDSICSGCGLNYFYDLPVGHGLNYPYKIEKDTLKIYGSSKNKWFSQQLVKASSGQHEINVFPKVINRADHKNEVIILNCLDYLYGHILLKLLNTTFYLDQFHDKGIITIIPSSFLWLVPSGVMEVWEVDIKLSESTKLLKGLNGFVESQIQRFTKVYLSPVYSHPSLQDVGIERYTKVEPFNLVEFDNKPYNVTFIYREDRLWQSGLFEYLSYLIIRRLKLLKYFKHFFVKRQVNKISNLFNSIKKSVPLCTFNVVGFGKNFSFSSEINDYRLNKIDSKLEKEWCEIYSISHVVVGIHGSNMLLPTAHAAGFVEILPDDRIGNITQDLFCKYNSRNMFFLGRFVSGFASVSKVSAHVSAIINGYKEFYIKSDKKMLRYETSINESDYIID